MQEREIEVYVCEKEHIHKIVAVIYTIPSTEILCIYDKSTHKLLKKDDFGYSFNECKKKTLKTLRRVIRENNRKYIHPYQKLLKQLKNLKEE